MTDLVFLDAESLGLDPFAPIWEVAALRRSQNGGTIGLHLHVQHDPEPWLAELPAQFANDYRNRFNQLRAHSPVDVGERLAALMRDHPHVVGAVPDFDTERIARQLLEPFGIDRPWHYHLIDVENLAVGYLVGAAARGDGYARQYIPDLPWRSEDLSRAIGVDPDQFDRHTAMGDVRWVMAQYDAVMGGAS